MSPATTPIEALTQLSLAVWLRTSPWAYPALEVMHIVGIVLMLGSVFVIDLKILGIGVASDRNVATAGSANKTPQGAPAASAEQLSKACLWWSVLGFTIIAFSGSMMLFARIAELISSTAFLWKLGLLSFGLANAILLHNRQGLILQDSVSKVQALFSILIWIATITAGRWIAYA